MPGRDATVVRTGDRHTFGNIQKCGSVWLCAVCQHKVAQQRADELQRAMRGAAAQGLRAAFITLTVRHARCDTLTDLAGRLAEARRALWSGRRAKKRREAFGVLGQVANLEVTWGQANGWHPHSHVLVFCESDADLDGLRESIWHGWRDAAARHGFDVERAAFDFQEVALQGGEGLHPEYAAGYVAKPPSSARRAWNLSEELAPAGTKDAAGARYAPFDLLDLWQTTRAGEWGHRWREYAEAFGGVGQGRGRRHLFWSRGLRDRLLTDEPEATDEELANAEGDGEVVHKLRRDEWDFLCAHDLARDFLDVCDTDGVEAARLALSGWRGLLSPLETCPRPPVGA